MGRSLAGLRIGVLQARHAREFAALLEREGATVVLAPSLREERGDGNQALVDYLRERGAEVVELSSYRWALPADVGPIERLLDELRERRLTATLFTSASQVENLFAVAAESGREDAVAAWLNERTLTAA